MPFEMGEHQHRVIAIQMRSHRHGLEPTAARNRPWRSAVFIQDVNGRESPAVRNERFTMSGRCSPRPAVKRIRFNDHGVRQLIYERFHPFARQNVGAARFARMKLHRDAAFKRALHGPQRSN